MNRIFIVLLILTTLFSCNEDPSQKAVEKIKKSAKEVAPLSLKITRFDEDFYRLKSSPAGLNTLKSRNPVFFRIYLERLLNLSRVDDPRLGFYINDFLSDKTVSEVHNQVFAQYKDLTAEEKVISEAFSRYQQFFPGKLIPRLQTMVTGLNYNTAATDSTLGIGLDMYLGRNCKLYRDVQYPRYQTYFMNRDRIPFDALKAWISSDYVLQGGKEDLLSEMIHEGKILVALDAIFPEIPDSVKIRYTAQQFNWLSVNQEKAWQYFIDKKLLFNIDYMEKRKYLGESPFTPGFPREAPPRLAQWFGWQIVRSYLVNQKGITLDQLFKEKNAEKILSQSKYKPLPIKID